MTRTYQQPKNMHQVQKARLQMIRDLIIDAGRTAQTRTELAQSIGMDRKALDKWRGKLGIDLTHIPRDRKKGGVLRKNIERNAAIMKLRSKGLTASQIASEMGITRSTVCGVLYREAAA